MSYKSPKHTCLAKIQDGPQVFLFKNVLSQSALFFNGFYFHAFVFNELIPKGHSAIHVPRQPPHQI